MDRKIRKYLADILTSILEIESFMADRPKEYATFCNDTLFNHIPLLKKEVEALLEE